MSVMDYNNDGIVDSQDVFVDLSAYIDVNSPMELAVLLNDEEVL